jgi:hypothetical protein
MGASSAAPYVLPLCCPATQNLNLIIPIRTHSAAAS